MEYVNMAMQWFGVLCLLSPIVVAAPAIAAEQNAAQAFLADSTLLANKRGWTVMDTMNMVQDQRTFATLAYLVRDEYPNDFSSGINIPSPGVAPTLYFKGSVPSGVSDKITQSGLTVTTVTGTGKDAGEWRDQAHAITDWLDLNSYNNFIVAFDDVDTIEVVIGGGLALPSLPPSISSDVSMSGAAGTLYTFTSSVRGGSQMYDGAESCTSGWTIENGGGTRGQVTAAHCLPTIEPLLESDQVEDRFGTKKGATEQAGSHLGNNGDVGWFTTLETEVSRFWADSLDHRPVEDVKGSFWRNDSTCGYGRQSDSRECDQVYRTSASFGTSLGTMKRMVLTDGDNGMVLGDSGGGWSFQCEAHGIASGISDFNGSDRSAFSKAHRLNNALGVEVREVP